MRKSTLAKRIKNLSLNHCTYEYQVVAELAGLKNYWRIDYNKKARPIYYQGSGFHSRLADHLGELEKVLNALKIKYEVGNDAPRGGKCGTYVRILTKMVNG